MSLKWISEVLEKEEYYLFPNSLFLTDDDITELYNEITKMGKNRNKQTIINDIKDSKTNTGFYYNTKGHSRNYSPAFIISKKDILNTFIEKRKIPNVQSILLYYEVDEIDGFTLEYLSHNLYSIYKNKNFPSEDFKRKFESRELSTGKSFIREFSEFVIHYSKSFASSIKISFEITEYNMKIEFDCSIPWGSSRFNFYSSTMISVPYTHKKITKIEKLND